MQAQQPIAPCLRQPTGAPDHTGTVTPAGVAALRLEAGERVGAGRKRAMARTSRRLAAGYWPGAVFGVREPAPAETPLSWDEVAHGMHWELL